MVPKQRVVRGDADASGGRLRGQTQVIGVVLLLGMVVLSATFIAISGTTVLDSFRQQTGQESTTNTVEEIDTQLSSISSVSGQTRTEFSIGEADANRFDIERTGYINVSVNKNASCTVHVPLSSIRYEADDGDTLVYEAGGIWRQPSDSDASVMHTPPDVTHSDGTLSMTLINATGRIENSENLVREDTTRSKSRTEEIKNTLFQGVCARPNNVTLSVQSDFYRAWSAYLDDEIDATDHHSYDGNQTVVVYLDQNELPEETDDEQNDVVDLGSSDFNDIEITNTSIKVNKSANNTYTTIVTPLSSGSTQVGAIRTVKSKAIHRTPIDVVFVIDESGSMGDDPDGDGDTKSEEAKEAAKSFVGQMNASYDRAGGTGFDDTARYLQDTSGNTIYLSNDFTAVNETIDSLGTGGGTHSIQGLKKANAILGLKSNSSRDKVIILLSDGKDDTGAADPVTEAERADKNGITIHSVGFGSPDNATLETVANATGGTYQYVDDSNDLSDVFVDLFAKISDSKHIVRDPVTMELSASGTTYHPQIDGNTSHIANTSDGNLNLNDPLAPTTYSYSIDITDGENVTMTAYDYDCDEWETTNFVHKNQSTGNKYSEVRCTDINESTVTTVPPKNMSVYIDGDDVSSLLDDPQDWWEEDLQNETLAPYLADDNETLVLESNAAIVVFRFPDGDGGTDRMITHYRIGQSSEKAVPSYVLNIEVRHLDIGRDD